MAFVSQRSVLLLTKVQIILYALFHVYVCSLLVLEGDTGIDLFLVFSTFLRIEFQWSVYFPLKV